MIYKMMNSEYNKLLSPGAHPGICQGGGGTSEFFSRVAKKSISISLTSSRGQVYVRLLIPINISGRQYTSRICWKNVTTQKMGNLNYDSHEMAFFSTL